MNVMLKASLVKTSTWLRTLCRKVYTIKIMGRIYYVNINRTLNKKQRIGTSLPFFLLISVVKYLYIYNMFKIDNTP